MIARAGLLAVLVTLACASPAFAWDPDRERWSAPTPRGPTLEPASDVAAPPGIYYVTDTYVADVTTRNGLLTTYSTTTVHESTGSYARVLDTVVTGAESSFDGAAFNGRASLGDGRPVAGTYYENYVLTSDGFVPVSVVFFQDDSELARLAGDREVAADKPGPTIIGPTASATIETGTVPCCPIAPAAWAPREQPDRPQAPGPELRPGRLDTPVSGQLLHVEVLRGRPVSIRLRAFAGPREIPVRSWTLVAGDRGDALAVAGPGSVPFRSAWRRLPPPGETYQLRFMLLVDTPSGQQGSIEATIAVTVRSPALAE